MSCFLTTNSFGYEFSDFLSYDYLLLWLRASSSYSHLVFWANLARVTPRDGSMAQSLRRFLTILLAAERVHSAFLPSPDWAPRCCPAPTWKAQDGEIGPALGEPWALPHAAPPKPFVLEHGGDGIVVQVLGAPHVHPRGSDAARQAQDGQEEAHHLACGSGHGFSPLALWPPPWDQLPPSSCGRCGPTVLPRRAALIRWFPSALGVCSQCFPLIVQFRSWVKGIIFSFVREAVPRGTCPAEPRRPSWFESRAGWVDASPKAVPASPPPALALPGACHQLGERLTCPVPLGIPTSLSVSLCSSWETAWLTSLKEMAPGISVLNQTFTFSPHNS